MIEQKSFKALANFYPKQIEAAERAENYDYILYGGAAGGGKSRWLRWTLLGRLIAFYVTRGLTNVRSGLFCETYTALDDRQLSKVAYEFPAWLGSMNQSRREFQLNPEYGGGILAFRNLDDPSKYLSSEFVDIGIDELTMNRRETFEFLLTRLRWPGVKDSKFFAATNPGQIGHGWVKKLWIDQDFSEEKFNPNSFTFVRSLYTDNPYIDHVSYGQRLASLPDALRRAYMEGDWDIFAGQFFTEFRRDQHVIEPFKDEKTLAWFNALPTYCGLDYGYHPHYSAVLWGKFHDGTWYIYRELYVREKTFEELKQLIIDIEEPVMIYADPSIWAKKDSPTSGADKMKPLPLRQAMNDRVIGWNGVKQLLKTSHIKIFSTCSNLIRTIPIQVYNERIGSMAEDLDTQAEDHLVDGLRYLIMTHKNIKPQQKALNYSTNASKIQSKGSGDLQELFTRKRPNSIIPLYH